MKKLRLVFMRIRILVTTIRDAIRQTREFEKELLGPLDKEKDHDETP